jgi:hypothetical protein
MNMEQLVEWELANETEIFGAVPQYHFLSRRPHMTWPEIEYVPRWWDAGS